MRTRLALLPALALASLACGGLFVSQDDRAKLVELVGHAPPENAVNLFVLAGAELGLVNARCGQCLEPFTMASAEMRQKLGANALMEASCLCPSTCVSELLEEVAPLEPAERMARVAETCDAEGPDPIFVDAFAALRPSVDVIDYAMVRQLAESLEGTDELLQLQEPLAVGLAVGRGSRGEPTDELVVTGHAPGPFADLADRLDGCEGGLDHRLVVRPDGAVAAVQGPGCRAELEGLELPGDGWRVIDVAWSAEGIAARGDPDAAPGEAAPGEAAPDEPGPDEAAPNEEARPVPRSSGPSLKVGRPTVQGSLSSDVVQKVSRSITNQLRYCYQRALTKNPGLAGKVLMNFVIAADGSVASVTVKEGMDPEVDACLEGRFKRLRFPEPAGGGVVIVAYPMVFAPG